MAILFVLHIILSLVLITSILLQQGSAGLGTVFGGGVSDTYKSKRGFDAFIYNVTIFVGVLFIANSLAIAITSVS